jgi:hypothetical protein
MSELTVTARTERGDQGKPIAQVDAGAVSVTVYESLNHPGRICIEVDGQPRLMILHVNDRLVTR